MARVDEDALCGSETALVFIACNVREARRAEDVLMGLGVDYCLSFEPFIRTSMFAAIVGPQENVGVGFTVASGDAAVCRDHLSRNGLRTGIVDEL
jgi:hypothetical protein